jgi:hypothetical protein
LLSCDADTRCRLNPSNLRRKSCLYSGLECTYGIVIEMCVCPVSSFKVAKLT